MSGRANRFKSLGRLLLAIGLLAGLLAGSGCGTVADQDWTPAPSTESDWIFDQAAPEIVTYPLADTESLSLLMADPGASELLAASTDYTGVRLSAEFVSFGELNDRLEAMAEAEDLPDLMATTNDSASFTGQTLAAAKLDVTSYVMENAPYYLAAMGSSETLKDLLLDDGELTTFYQLSQGSEGADYGPYIRSDWLEELGLEIPRTYDEYETVLQAFHDTYGCSDALLLPATGAIQGDYLSAGFGIAAYVSGRDYSSLGFYVRDGIVKFGPLEQGYWDFTALLHSWYEKGFISPDFVSANARQLLVGDQVGLLYLESSQIDTLQQIVGDGSGALVPIPDAVMEVGDTLHLSMDSNELIRQAAFCVSTSCQDPGLAVRWCDFWYSPEGQMLTNWGVEGETYTLDGDGQPVYTEALLSSPVLQVQYFCDQLPGFWDLDLARERRDWQRLEASSTWLEGKDSAWRISSDLALSDSDAERFSNMLVAITTYTAGLTDQLIVGVKSVADQDKYIAELRDLGIDKCIACLQAYVEQ